LLTDYFEIGSLGAYFTGDSHGQSKEASCDAQENLETWKGKRQACAQEDVKASDAEKAAIEDRDKNGTEKTVKTRRAGHRRHDRRCGR
jgi:hypothetical protein